MNAEPFEVLSWRSVLPSMPRYAPAAAPTLSTWAASVIAWVAIEPLSDDALKFDTVWVTV